MGCPCPSVYATHCAESAGNIYSCYNSEEAQEDRARRSNICPLLTAACSVSRLQAQHPNWTATTSDITATTTTTTAATNWSANHFNLVRHLSQHHPTFATYALLFSCWRFRVEVTTDLPPPIFIHPLLLQREYKHRWGSTHSTWHCGRMLGFMVYSTHSTHTGQTYYDYQEVFGGMGEGRRIANAT